MLQHSRTNSRMLTVVGAIALGLSVHTVARSQAAQQQCLDVSSDPAGCQPSTFDTPVGDMPSARVNKLGELDATSSEEDTRAGVALLEKRLRLFRNIEHLHWVITVPSVKDAATGKWKDGDLDAAGDARGLAIAGNCLFVGHENGAGKRNAVNIFRLQADPVKQPPVQVGSIPANVDGNRGNDDRELRALTYTTSNKESRLILVRNGGGANTGRLETYRIDPNTCLPSDHSDPSDFSIQTHEFFLWHDPANSNRVLAFVTNWSGGLPDPEHPGVNMPDLLVMAVTDEKTGEMLRKAKFLAGFSLQDVGGPPINEKPDATGLFSDGRFLDFSHLQNLARRAGNFQNVEQNRLHSVSVSDDGERVYAAGTTAGFYILNSEAVARRSDAELSAGTAGCNQRSTIVSANGRIDATKLPMLANDCVHMVINDDPGLKATLASSGSPEFKAERYLVLMTRSRFDVYPPVNSLPTATHSAVIVPGRPARVPGQHSAAAVLCVAHRRERRLSAQLRAHRLGRVGDHADHGRGVRHSRQPDRPVPRTGRDRAQWAAPQPDCAAEPQPDGLQKPRFQHLVWPRPAGDRHLQPVHAAGSGLRHYASAWNRPIVPSVQGRANLLDRQPDWTARRPLHWAESERTAWTGLRCVRRQRDEPPPVDSDRMCNGEG